MSTPLEQCGESFVGRWTGDIYVCQLKGVHLIHRGYCGEDQMEWPNDKDFCASPFPGTHDFCKRPPGHPGYCRIKRHGKVITFKVGRRA